MYKKINKKKIVLQCHSHLCHIFHFPHLVFQKSCTAAASHECICRLFNDFEDGKIDCL